MKTALLLDHIDEYEKYNHPRVMQTTSYYITYFSDMFV